MKRSYIIWLILLTLTACTGKQERLSTAIHKLEQSEDVGEPETLKELASLYAEYGMAFHDSIAARYLYSAATFYYQEKDSDKATDLYFEFLSRDDSSELFRNAAINLAELLSKEGDYTMANDLISEMLDKQIPSYQQWLTIAGIYSPIVDTGGTVNDYHRLEMAYTATGQFDRSIQTLEKGIERFPTDPRKADLIYRAGFIGWEYLNNKDVAEKYYQLFIDEFPDDPRASQAEQILSSGMLSMTDQEIVEMIKQKQNQ